MIEGWYGGLFGAWLGALLILFDAGNSWARSSRTDAGLVILKFNGSLRLALWRHKYGPDTIIGMVDDGQGATTIYRRKDGRDHVGVTLQSVT